MVVRSREFGWFTQRRLQKIWTMYVLAMVTHRHQGAMRARLQSLRNAKLDFEIDLNAHCDK